MGQDTGTDDGTNSKALGPHTGLDDLLRRRLVFVCHDDRGRDAHAERPAAEDRAEDLAAADVDVAREEDGHVVRGGERVGGDVGAERGEHEGERGKERGRAVVPLVDERERVPEHLAVQDDACRGHGDARESDQSEGNGDDDELDILARLNFSLYLAFADT